jgi:uncharacterized membrane protein YbhN (UPF0104 family)
MSRWKILALWFSGLLLLGWLVNLISPAELGSVLRGVDVRLLLLATLLSLVATVLGACNSYLFVSINHPVGMRAWLGYFWLGWAVGLVMPGQVGDVGLLSWLMKRRGMRWTHSLGRLFLDKLVSLMVMALLALWGLLDVLGRLELAAQSVFTGLCGLVSGVVLLALSYRLPPVRRMVEHGINVLREAIGVARRYPQRLLLNVVLTLLKVVILSLSFWFVFKAVGLHTVAFPLLLRLMAVGSLVAYLPLSVNGVGTVEVTAIALFALYGVEPAPVLAAYLVARALTLALALIPALLGLATAAVLRGQSAA